MKKDRKMNNVKYSIYNEQIKKNKIAKVRLTIKRVRYLPDAYLTLLVVRLALNILKISYLKI